MYNSVPITIHPENSALIFIYVERAWGHFKHEIPAKSAWCEMFAWLIDNVGSIGDPRVEHANWDNEARWCWSLTNGSKWDLPCGVYFKYRIDAMRFLLTYSDASLTR